MEINRVIPILVTFFLTSIVYAQFDEGGNVKRRYCFEKSIEKMGERFVSWDCGKSDRILDCNEKLESDPGSSLVVHRKSRTPYTGTCETCHNNGLKQRVVNFRDGKVHGIDTTYYTSGCPQVVREHIDGVESGTWTYFNDSSGLVAWRTQFRDGEKHGKSINYSHYMVGTDKMTVKIGQSEKEIRFGIYERDTIKIEHFKNGKLDGQKKEYYPGSKIRKEVSYKEGRLDGPYIYYDEEGNILQELEYKNGKKHGEWKFYYDNGKLLRTENWSEGVKSGEFKTFFIQGFVQELEVYNDKGQKHGWFETRFPDEKIKRRARYRRDQLIEEHVFDEYGNEIKTVGKPVEVDEDDEVPEAKSKGDRKWWQFWKKK